MASSQALPIFTPEEYLSLERCSDTRHEYLDGFVYAMAGESPEHSTICFNLAGHIGAQLLDSPYRGYSPNMKVRTDRNDLFSYPDLTIVCGEPLYHDKRRDVALNPTVVFEVLSRSTEKYDRGEKSLRYRTQIDSLQNYVLVSQDKPRIECFTRQADGTWSESEVSGLTEVLDLPSIKCRIALADVYRRIVFKDS